MHAPAPCDDHFDSLSEDQLLPLLGSAYHTALRLTRNPADAEDLVQEAALLAARGFRSFQTGTNFKAWFYRILTNAYFSKYRQERRLNGEGATTASRLNVVRTDK